MYRANRPCSFWKRTPYVPRPRAADVISRFRNKKRRHNESFETVPYPCTLSVKQDILSTRVVWSDSLSLCLLKLKVTLHTLYNPLLVPLLLKSVSIVSEVGMFQRNRILVAANLTPGKGVVKTPLCATEPRVPLRSNLDDPEEWEPPCSDSESACWDEVHRTEPVACRPIIKSCWARKWREQNHRHFAHNIPSHMRLVSAHISQRDVKFAGTMRAETNSNDFGFFFKLISRFEFEFRRRENDFFERFEFLVSSKFNHTQWPYMCMCCGLFAPTQFHSEYVVSVTIHDGMYKSIYIYVRDVAKT